MISPLPNTRIQVQGRRGKCRRRHRRTRHRRVHKHLAGRRTRVAQARPPHVSLDSECTHGAHYPPIHPTFRRSELHIDGDPRQEAWLQRGLDETSGSETRCIRNPPRPGGISEEKAALGAHTGFGSMVGCCYCMASFVGGADHKLGTDLLAQPSRGLQVMPPGSDRWLYIRVGIHARGHILTLRIDHGSAL